MKSYGVVWPSVGKVEIEEFEVPEPGPGEVLVKTAYSAISPGTERGWLLDFRHMVNYPFRPGYSATGNVAAVGEGVDTVKPGDPVCVWGPHAAYVKAVASRVVPIPEGVDLESAVFFHLGFVSINGTRRARIELGEPVAVIGQGLLGLLAMRMAKLQGGLPVIALDLEESRLERARAFGADLTLNPSNAEELKQTMASLDGGGPPVVMAVDIVRRLGRVVSLGSLQRGGEVNPEIFHRIHRMGIEFIGAQTTARPVIESRANSWT